jgi:alpha-glucuronidase
MALDGYVVEPVTPWETASGGKAIGCLQPACSASFRSENNAGRYDLAVQYFDERSGAARY